MRCEAELISSGFSRKPGQRLRLRRNARGECLVLQRHIRGANAPVQLEPLPLSSAPFATEPRFDDGPFSWRKLGAASDERWDDVSGLSRGVMGVELRRLDRAVDVAIHDPGLMIPEREDRENTK